MSESKTVLLVEDNEDNRIVYATMLEHYGYTVVETANGEDAVRIAKDEIPDLILMDISIPGIDGWTATERLREDPRTAEIPVVAVTAHALPEHRARAESLRCVQIPHHIGMAAASRALGADAPRALISLAIASSATLRSIGSRLTKTAATFRPLS